jgi:hypothetical protein
MPSKKSSGDNLQCPIVIKPIFSQQDKIVPSGSKTSNASSLIKDGQLAQKSRLMLAEIFVT